MTETNRYAHTFTMRNVILSLALFLGCSDGSGFVAAPDAGPAGTLTGVTRGRQVETGGQGGNVQLLASQDAQALDSRVVAADALLVQADTYPTPSPVEWTPGAESTNPALATCPSTKGNSLGIGKACSNAVGGTRCPAGLTCLCGGELGPVSTPMVTKAMPCMCTAVTVGGPNVASDCPPCGEGAGCCTLRNSINALWACMPNACADAYCRPYTAGAR